MQQTVWWVIYNCLGSWLGAIGAKHLSGEWADWGTLEYHWPAGVSSLAITSPSAREKRRSALYCLLLG